MSYAAEEGVGESLEPSCERKSSEGGGGVAGEAGDDVDESGEKWVAGESRSACIPCARLPCAGCDASYAGRQTDARTRVSAAPLLKCAECHQYSARARGTQQHLPHLALTHLPELSGPHTDTRQHAMVLVPTPLAVIVAVILLASGLSVTTFAAIQLVRKKLRSFAQPQRVRALERNLGRTREEARNKRVVGFFHPYWCASPSSSSTACILC